jgi:hypothetical protein
MARYRFCLFDRWSTMFFADAFECAEDGDAAKIVVQRLGDHPTAHSFELWNVSRLVLAGTAAQHRSK